jgi:hypothetical protein
VAVEADFLVVLGVRQDIDLLRHELSTFLRPVATNEVSGALAACNDHYVTIFGVCGSSTRSRCVCFFFLMAPGFQDFVRKEIRTLLMNKHLAVYRLEKPRNSPRRAKSLLTLVLVRVPGLFASLVVLM